MTVYKTLANMDFAGKLYEAKAQTTTGKNFLNKYQAYCINNPITCGVVNSFIKEAKEYLYDHGVLSAYESVASIIAENKYSWAIATTCENINSSNQKGNYLNRRAAEQVAPLLEMNESDVVAYIKSGAFKSVSYVEQFRNIANSVYHDQPVVESNAQYTMIHPISVIEQNNNQVFFEVLGEVYKIVEDRIEEAKASEVSQDFITMSQILESDNVKLVGESLEMTLGNRKYTVSEAGKCTVNMEGRVVEMNVDQLRENNAIYCNASVMNRRNQYAYILEGFAKVVEKYDTLGILNNVSVVSTTNDRFLVIENKGNAYAKMLQTNHTQNWKVTDNIVEACKVIKKNTRVDLTENYQVSIDKVVENVTEQEGKQITESLEAEQMSTRKQRIADLTERFKNDPARLAMLSKLAEDLAEIEK